MHVRRAWDKPARDVESIRLGCPKKCEIPFGGSLLMGFPDTAQSLNSGSFRFVSNAPYCFPVAFKTFLSTLGYVSSCVTPNSNAWCPFGLPQMTESKAGYPKRAQPHTDAPGPASVTVGSCSEVRRSTKSRAKDLRQELLTQGDARLACVRIIPLLFLFQEAWKCTPNPGRIKRAT